ncbi:hypothetical protein D3C81_1863890 [compost metagenome]
MPGKPITGTPRKWPKVRGFPGLMASFHSASSPSSRRAMPRKSASPTDTPPVERIRSTFPSSPRRARVVSRSSGRIPASITSQPRRCNQLQSNTRLLL